MIWPFKKKTVLPPRERSDAWPEFENGDCPFVCWTHPDNKHRVFVIAQHDGTFSKRAEFFDDGEREMCWIPEDEGLSLYDTLEIAMHEIHQLFPWTNDFEPERTDEAEQKN